MLDTPGYDESIYDVVADITAICCYRRYVAILRAVSYSGVNRVALSIIALFENYIFHDDSL